mgnify:CR=1 FL=1
MNVLENELVQKRIKEFPLENLLFETDSPIKFNERNVLPENIQDIARKVAEIKEMEISEIEKQQEKNFNSLFEN